MKAKISEAEELQLPVFYLEDNKNIVKKLTHIIEQGEKNMKIKSVFLLWSARIRDSENRKRIKKTWTPCSILEYKRRAAGCDGRCRDCSF